mmetsp:Transcript_81295/g.243753  ORF Transcript_81295/g.243753 Transcript_81295/m.243753 type:complete len:201 (+) Transcript_81295:418-1020(+)
MRQVGDAQLCPRVLPPGGLARRDGPVRGGLDSRALRTHGAVAQRGLPSERHHLPKAAASCAHRHGCRRRRGRVVRRAGRVGQLPSRPCALADRALPPDCDQGPGARRVLRAARRGFLQADPRRPATVRAGGRREQLRGVPGGRAAAARLHDGAADGDRGARARRRRRMEPLPSDGVGDTMGLQGAAAQPEADDASHSRRP